MKKGSALFVLAVATVLVGGCGTPREARSLLCAKTDEATLFAAAREALEDLHFILETADEEAGLIRTWPLRGAQFFEVWRGDNESPQMAAMSNLHSLQRIAEIELAGSPGQTCLSCKVYLRRLSMPGEFTGGTRQMAALFTEGSFARQSLLLEAERVEAEKIAWIDLGRDEALEQELLDRIEKEIR